MDLSVARPRVIGMGALKPWHVGLLVCLAACVALIVTAVVVAVNKTRRRGR